MSFYPCRGGGGKVKLVTVDVTSKDFPDLFTYIDSRSNTYKIATEDKKIISVSYEVIVGHNSYHASSITFKDYSGTDTKEYINKPSTGVIDKAFNGLQIFMSSTTSDGDLHFNKLSYTYIQT